MRVTIAAGLRDTHGRTLDHDFSWSFSTAAIALADLPLQTDSQASPEPGPLLPTIRFSSNTALDVHSLATHGSLVPDSGGTAIGLVAPPAPASSASPAPPPDESFDPSERAFVYTLVPAQSLAKGTAYRIVFAPGIAPVAGNQPSSATFTGRLRTYGRLTFDGLTQDQESSDRFNSGTPQLSFSNPIDSKTLGAVHVSPAPAAGTAIGTMGATVIGKSKSGTARAQHHVHRDDRSDARRHVRSDARHHRNRDVPHDRPHDVALGSHRNGALSRTAHRGAQRDQP